MGVSGKRSGQEHLLVIRLSAMGDVAMTVPVLAAFRAANPGVKITVLTRTFFQPFFRDIPGIYFIEPDFKRRHKGFIGLLRLYSEISRTGVTSVADLHDVLRTKILRALFRVRGKKIAVIDKGRSDKKKLTRKFNKLLVPLEHTIDRYRDTFVRLGYAALQPCLPENKELPVPEIMSAVAGEKSGKWIGVAPFAQHAGKIYPTEMTASLIGILASDYQRVFIFGGGPAEREFAEFMQNTHANVTSVIGRITLGQELDLISNLDIMVSMDSSAMHMASLMGVPVVSVWGATHPWAGFYGFGQNPANAVQLDLPCRPCSVYGNKPCIYGDYRCLNGINPESIAERVDEVLKR